MPAFQSRAQARGEEYPELPITGPFGGTISELPPTEIEELGFQDSTNFLFRKGFASVRPGYTALAAMPDGFPALGIADFFTKNGVHIQVAITKAHVYQWNGSGWNTALTGTAFTGSASQLWSWDILGNKLCFSQGSDIIWFWDGITAGYSQTSASAPAANHIAEIGLHLMALNTLEGGTAFPQRYHWSGSGDPTDWTSFSSGINDNLNNLGPGNGLIKLGQYGFGIHFNGIVQIQPTGIGTNPFAFYPIVNASIGDIAPSSLDHFNRDGIEQCCFVALDNVYLFNQTSVIPIGDMPLDGRRRIGARSRILADIQSSGNLSGVHGFVTNSINGQVFNAYWLIVPGQRIWCFNFDESNWTPFTFDRSPLVQGKFFKSQVPRIIDLVGTIAAQSWTPATLVNTSPFPGHAISFSDGTFGYIDFTNFSETAAQIVGPKHTFGDRRHKHTINKSRVVVLDQGAATYTITWQNEKGVSTSTQITLGSGTGDVLSQVVTFTPPISGLRLQWTIQCTAGQPGSLVEFAPIYSTEGEQRGGSADNN